MYSTEDNRSSFTGIIKGNGKSKKSSGGGHKNSGSGSGNHYATMNTGLQQNKTSSSKNTNTLRKTRRKREINGCSGEYNHLANKNNFLDEFSQFEEQFENNQIKQKVIINDKIGINEHPIVNKKAPARDKRLSQRQDFNILNQLQTKEDDALGANYPKLNTSFAKSGSSDGMLG